MATVLDVITAALGDLAVLEEGEAPNASQSETALAALNAWLDEQKLAPGSMYTITRTLKQITANDGEYSVGAGADIAIARPVNMAAIDRVNLLDTTPDPDLETPLYRQTEADYQRTSQKALTATYPSEWYYNPTYPTGTLILYPVPTGSTLYLALYARAAVAEFAAITDTITLPPGYRRWFIKSLAVELAASYGKQPNPMLLMAAADSKAAVKRANYRPVEQTFGADVPGVAGRRYDIRRA